MPRRYPQLVFGDSVKAVQERYGTREQGRRLETMEVADDRLTPREAEFIAQRDGFYVASVAESGWPYVQFRGGPPGFLRILDERTLGFADFRGNLQYITTGNVVRDDRVALFLMDYARRRRLKIMARADVLEADEHPELRDALTMPDYPARIERLVIYRLEAFDWNCPQHIRPRFTEQEIEVREIWLTSRVEELEAEVARLRRAAGEVGGEEA